MESANNENENFVKKEEDIKTMYSQEEYDALKKELNMKIDEYINVINNLNKDLVEANNLLEHYKIIANIYYLSIVKKE